MNEIAGSVAFDVIAEFDDAKFADNVAKGAQRGRDEMGRFVKEHRTISQNMMRDFGSILSSGTSSAMSVMSRNMQSGADAAGKGFLNRMSGAMKAVPKAMASSMASGAIGVVSQAGRSLGEHVSNAVSDQVQKSAPFWKRAFTSSFNQAANVDTTQALGALANKIKGGGDNAGKGFQEALGDRFSRAGIVASAKLGNFAAQVANRIVPGAREAGAKATEAIGGPFRDKLPTILKVGATAAAGVGAIALINRFRKGGSDAADAAGNELVEGGESAGQAAGDATADGYEDGVEKLPSIATRAMQAVSSAMGKAAAAAGKFAAETFGDALSLGVNLVGGTVAGVLGTSLAKGLGRLTAIDNAEASLRGLAATASHVPEIMDSVNAAMTGTAFGLDQGAKAAAQFAAAQVPISDMERHLSALANTAAAAGGDFDGMSDIFAKVAARGNVTGEVLNQLTSRGISGLAALAEHFGTSTEAVQEMVSAGEVSFDDFSQAMDAAMGSVAIEQASTFQGLMANVGAAMGRFGAVMQKPFFEATKAALPGVINLFDQFKKVVEPLMEIIADRLIPYAEALGERLGKLDFSAPSAGASQLFGSLAALAPIVGGLAAAFSGPILSSIPVIGPMLSGLTGPVGVLAGALVALFAVKPETLLSGMQTLTGALPDMLSKVIDKVDEMVPELMARFSSNLPILIQGFTSLLGQIVDAVARLAPMIIPAVIDAILQLVDAVAGMLPQLVEMGLSLVMGLMDGIMAAVPVLAQQVPAIVNTLIDGVVRILPALVTVGAEMVVALIDGLVKALPDIIRGGIDMMNGIIQGITVSIPAIIDAVVEAIPMVLDALVDAFPLLLQGGLALILGIVEGIVDGLPLLITAMVDAIPELIDALMRSLPQLIQGGIELVLGLVLGIVKAIPRIVTAVTDAIPLVIGGIVDALPDLIEGGIQLVLGLIGGIIEAIPQIVVAVVGAIPEIITGLLGAMGDLIWGGIQLILGLIEGIARATPDIVQAMIDLIPKLISGLMKAFPELTAFFKDSWNNITKGIEEAWNAVVTFFSDTWKNITKGAETAWNNFKKWIEGLFWEMVAKGMEIWNGLVEFFTGLWNTIQTATSDAWNAITSWLRNTFQGAIDKGIEIWNGLVGFFTGLWGGIEGTFNKFLKFVREEPKKAFEKAVGAISDVWDGIREAAKKPVRFVIETVINKGIIDTLNGLPGVNLSRISLPPGFARGGVLPGYGAAKRDTILTPMRAGEGVLVPEVVRGLGPDFVHSLNAVGNAGGVAAVRREFGAGIPLHPGRALGGLITPLPKGSWTMSQPYHAGHNGYDMAAAMGTKILAAADGLVQMAQSVHMGGNEIYIAHKRLATRYSHLSRFNVRAGQAVKQGQVIGLVGSTGYSTGPHLHYMVHRPNDGGNGFGYRNHVNPAPYIGTYGKAFDGIDLLGGLVDWATDRLRGAFPDGGIWVDAASGVMRSGVTQLKDWGMSILGFDRDDRGRTGVAGLVDAQPKLYDRGGWLPHGGVGVNLSGKPEAVFTNEESQALKELLANGGGRVVNIEEGAIVIQGAIDPVRTSMDVLDRLAEELEVN